MDGSNTEIEPARLLVPRQPRRRWRLAAGLVILLLVLGFALVWGSREQIADNYIASQLRQNGLSATYKVERIGPRRQILRDVVIGNPGRPDLTVEQLHVAIRYRLGFPTIGRIVAYRPRLYGAYRGGRLSFGTLDKVLFEGGDPDKPFRLPNLDVAVVDGRGLIDSEWGPIGLKVVGAGKLRGGFSGTLAAIAPQAVVAGCQVTRASLYGAATIRAERLRFTGPLRLSALSCPDGTRLAKAGLQVEATLDKGFDGGEGTLGLETGQAVLAGAGASSLKGTARAAFRANSLTARYDVAARGANAQSLAAGVLSTEGTLRTQNGFARMELEGSLAGQNVALGSGLDRGLADLEQAMAATMLGPMIGQVRTALRREAPGSRLAASYRARFAEGTSNVVVPQASLRGRSGATLVALSRFQANWAGGGAPLLSGNVVTGGPGLPRLSGRMERAAQGAAVLRLSIAEYRAGAGSLAVPSLVVAQTADGALGFNGQVRVSGQLPGGAARNLVAPIDGNWSSGGGLALWRRCARVGFDALTYANLTLDRRSLILCPPPGGAIVRSTAAGTRFAAGTTNLDVTGRLGSTPIRIQSATAGFAAPGRLQARGLAVALGPQATASRFNVGQLAATVGKTIVGRFEQAEMRLHAVPMDLLDAAGGWSYAGNTLQIAGASFQLVDRRADARFQPLQGRGGSITLRGNALAATASLAEPRTGREVTRADIHHDLASGRGHADLTTAGLQFDRALQPATVSRLFLGVVANVRGTVRGTGRVAWGDSGTTSSGRFSTDDLDFAAGFGPVKGASGTVVFTDLLGLVTAPHQKLSVRSVNPGIEVNDGVIDFELRPGSVLAINSATWPFMGGTLTLQPTTLNMGVTEARRYTLRIDGLDAARFVAQMELANISASGIFDGVLPLVFDEGGGRIEGGRLQSRPPGGNVSYVGELTRKDLSTIANFAFDALKSLDYRSMSLTLDGRLTGEIVSRVRFDSVRQGVGAKQNFITRRIGKLPIQFNINLKAPFYQLITSFKSFNDPAFVRDPRSVGLLNNEGRPIDDEVTNPPPPASARNPAAVVPNP